MNPHLQVDAEHTVGDCTEWVDANVEDSAGRLPVSDAYDAASRAVLILQSSARLASVPSRDHAALLAAGGCTRSMRRSSQQSHMRRWTRSTSLLRCPVAPRPGRLYRRALPLNKQSEAS